MDGGEEDSPPEGCPPRKDRSLRQILKEGWEVKGEIWDEEGWEGRADGAAPKFDERGRYEKIVGQRGALLDIR